MSGLPLGWAETTLARLMDRGLFIDGDWVETKDQDEDGEVRLTQLADIGEGCWRNRSNRSMTRESAKRLGCTYLEKGDVLVARMPDPLGRACMFPGDPRPAVTVVDVCVMRPHPDNANPNWLMWFLNAPPMRAKIAALQSGTTRKRISRKNLGSLTIPVPPVAEQRRIVEVIEEQFSHLDAAKASLERALKRVRTARELAFTSVARFDSASYSPLGDIADILGGVTKDSKRETDLGFIEVTYLRVANVQRGYLDLSDVATIRVDRGKAEKLRLMPGDILFNEGGDRDKLGRGWIWEGQIEGCIHQNHVFRARVDPNVYEPKFISLYGNTVGRQWFERMGRQTTNLASLNLTTLKSFPIPRVPIEDQRRVVAETERQLSVYDRMVVELETALGRSRCLRRAVLETAFTGRLVARDETDSPAWRDVATQTDRCRPLNHMGASGVAMTAAEAVIRV